MMVLVMVLLIATLFNGQAGPRKFETTVRSQSNGKYLTLPRREAARSNVRFTVRPRFFSPRHWRIASQGIVGFQAKRNYLSTIKPQHAFELINFAHLRVKFA